MTDRLAALPGLITTEVGEALAAFAAEVPEDQAIVEVGSFRGKSTAYLATGAKAGHGAHVYAVDPWDLPGTVYGKHGYNVPQVRADFEANLRAVRLWSRITPLHGFSVDQAAAWDGPPIGLLFIDADHEADSVRADVNAWAPHLADGATVVLDDLDTPRNPGVRVVAEELEADGWTFEVQAERLAVLTR